MMILSLSEIAMTSGVDAVSLAVWNLAAEDERLYDKRPGDRHSRTHKTI